MYTKKNKINSRSYSVLFDVAENALKTIKKSKECADYSAEKTGDYYLDRPDNAYIFFNITQLRMICFDYAFSALENFLEHIGFILFDDWDSQKKQRHYIKKQEKLLNFFETIEQEYQPSLDYEKLNSEWRQIIESIHLGYHANKRNPIKHVHSENHDSKISIVSSQTTMIDADEYYQLIDGTLLDFTDEECDKFLEEIKSFIYLVHSFVSKHILIFKIYTDYNSHQKIERRKDLLEIFLVNPFATTIYSSTLTANKVGNAG